MRHQFRKLNTADSIQQQQQPPSIEGATSKGDEVMDGVSSFELLLDHLRGAQDDMQVAKYLETMVALLTREPLQSSYQRKSLLRVIGRHLASENSSIMFPLVDSLLLLKVVRSNFAMASKLLFKLAKV